MGTLVDAVGRRYPNSRPDKTAPRGRLSSGIAKNAKGAIIGTKLDLEITKRKVFRRGRNAVATRI